ncbi:hypothetical protein [Halopiger xanaduensis]|uniref:Glycerophosphoryl diester phosphodiesterase membrane domain-containing protein n=1 Tax=Halopiger xanaduensis (strain DSM 18323 / JCM 14033 / SH-6) TaxID=797210 RepID=F8DC13_HALXS|nr:hypothetical protein [Halopiger xanaduensis]AEH35992.1 hypothetical protein Halxa_1359 [Halopiger xanaduensis SH-6]
MVPDPDSPSDHAAGPPSRDRSSDAFSRHVSRVTDRFDELLPYAVVPLVLSLLEVGKIERVLDPHRTSFSVQFSLPSPLLELWSLVDPPDPASTGSSTTTGWDTGAPFEDTGGAAPVGGPTATGPEITIETPVESIVLPVDAVGSVQLAWLGILLLAYGVIAAAVAAGYLGGIDRRLRGEPAVLLACVVDYAPRLFAYYLVVFAAFLALLPIALIAPPLLLLGVPLVLVLGYCFYAAPFLLVVADAGVLEAFRRSYGFATAGGAYFWFALGHVLVTAIVSIVLSVLLNGGIVGFVIALLVASPVGLVLTAATVSLCQELVDGDDETYRDPIADRDRFDSSG